ncbi:hypothetical protein [Limnoglobus roseus]|uniref:Suppressor of fused-like domain-containing protein n=1 Tax=Limnoglobus roseus TaxID=2598579 RepID=A0A5C1AHN7_9BACT|nr:hypothetical protein [Limnoglobus roseus]QEL17687.1 hypothetical protein PX52LOC_04686 [Limnoglobus roseus]
MRAAWGEPGELDRLRSATVEARRAYFHTLGEPDPDVWLALVNPVLGEEPAWPGRPAWQRIRTAGQTTIVSSGLTDPFPSADGPNLGHGIEVALVTKDAMTRDLEPCWLLELAQELSYQAARDARFHLRYAKFGMFLMGVHNASSVYESWADEGGTMGFLLGLPTPSVPTAIPLPIGTATLLVAKLLTPAEYAFVAAHGVSGARHLVERFAVDGTDHGSSLDRRSVI